MRHDRAPEPRKELRGRELAEEGRAAVVALGVDREDEPRGDAERQCPISILVGNPTEVGLQGLELGALLSAARSNCTKCLPRALRCALVLPATSK